MQAIGSVMTAGMNAILISFNQTAVALFGIYFKLQSFVFMPVFGLNNGLMPIIGYNFGAGNKKRLLSALKIGTVIAAVIMAAGTLIFWLFPEWLLSIFEASDQMVEIGVPALRSISLCFIPAAIGIVCSTPVSYTHLDVYKRQRLACRRFGSLRSISRSLLSVSLLVLSSRH